MTRWAMRRRRRSLYFIVGIVALIWGLMVPWATRKVPRRWAYTGGVVLYLVGNDAGR